METYKNQLIENSANEIVRSFESGFANKDDIVDYLKNLLNKYESDLIKNQKFNRNRKMFYISKNGSVIEPIEKYQDLSHFEWFKAMGIDFYNTVRGFYSQKDNYVIIYVGPNFDAPDFDYNSLIAIKKHFPNINYIGLGAKVDNIGENWEPLKKITIDITKDNDTTTNFKITIL